MTSKSVIIGFAFEGLGSSTSESAGDCYYFGRNLPDNTASSYQWIPALSKLPGSIATSVNPFTGGWSTSAFNIELDASDRVATTFMSDQRTAPYALAAAADELASSVTIIDGAGAAVTTLAGTVVYVGDESMLLGAHSGGGAYPVTRGFWTSPTQAHASGANVFTRVPYWQGRVVRLIEQDVSTGTERERWRGVVRNIAQRGPNVVVSTAELLSTLQGVEVNTNAPNLSEGFRFRQVITGVSAQILGESDFTSQVYPDAAYPADAEFTIQFDDTIAKVEDPAFPRGVLSLSGRGVLRQNILFDSGVELAQGEQSSTERVFEVLAIERNPANESTGGANPFRGLIAAGPLNLPFHPLVIALALLTSTGTGANGGLDVLGSTWGLGIDYVDLAAWETAISAEPGLKIDRLVLGFDGEPVNTLQVVQEKLLRPFGFFLAISADGSLGLGRLRLPELDDFISAPSVSPYPDLNLTLDRGLQDSASEVVALVGDLPFRDGRRVTVRDGSRSTRAATLTNTVKHELDLSVFDPARVGAGTTGDALTSTLVSLLAVGLDTAPTLNIRVADYIVTGDPAFDLGVLVRLEDLGGLQDAWLVDADGNRVDVTSADDLTAFAGIVVSRNWNLQDHSYSLGLRLLGYRIGGFVRGRAPAAVVSTDSSGLTTVTLDTTGPYGASPGTAFTVGDEVQAWTSDGRLINIDTPKVVTAVAAGTLTLDAAFLSCPAAAIVRLAKSALYSNPTPSGGLTNRSYVYLADGSLADPSFNGDPGGPDFFGTRINASPVGTAPAEPDFIALDEESLAVVGTDAQPLDAWLAYTLRDRESRLVQDGRQISWVPVTANAGDLTVDTDHRPYGSVARSTLLYIPWIVEPGLREILVTMAARVATESPDAGDQTDTLDFFVTLGESEQRSTLANTQADSPPFDDIQVTLDVGDVITSRGYRNLVLGVQSTQGTDGVTSLPSASRFAGFQGLFIGPTSTTDQTYANVNMTVTRPVVGGGDTEVIVYESSNKGQTQGGIDWVHHNQETLSFTGGATLSSDVAYLVANRSSREDVRRVEKNYIQVRGVEFTQSFTDSTYLTDASLRPREPVLSEVEVTHLLRNNTAHARARCLWIGPQGDRPGVLANPAYPPGYTRRFIRLNRSSTPQAVFESLVWLETVNPRVTILFNMLPYHLVGLLPEQGPLTELAATAGWNFYADALQLVDSGNDYGGATTILAASDPQQRSVLHFPTPVAPVSPALMGEQLTSDIGDWNFNEGTLFAADERLVDTNGTFAVSVDVTYDPSTLDRPVMLRLYADSDGSNAEFGVLQNTTNDFLYLMIVGASIWEIPQ